MKHLHPVKLLGITENLLIPVQKALAAVLPDFIERDLKDPAVRKQVVTLADKYLTKQYPQATLVRKTTRQRIIARSLEIILDEVLLPGAD